MEQVDIYEQEQPDGRFLKHIKFRFPVYFGDRETQELCWDNESTVETVVLLSHKKPDGHIEEDSTIRNFRIVQTEGSRQVTRNTKHYNLQMTIAVGFKVNNERAVQFRKWANGIVKDYIIKGWVMDDERLKRGTYLTEKYDIETYFAYNAGLGKTA